MSSLYFLPSPITAPLQSTQTSTFNSLTMPLELRDVEFSDGEAISYVYITAFFDDPFNKTQFPGVSFERLLAGAISRWPRNYGDITGHYKKVVDTDTGKVVSYSKWSFANTTAGGQLRKPIGQSPGLCFFTSESGMLKL